MSSRPSEEHDGNPSGHPIRLPIETQAGITGGSVDSPTGSLSSRSSRSTVHDADWGDLPTGEGYFDQTVTFNFNGNQYRALVTPPQSESSPMMVFHHGAGSTALSFALLAKGLAKKIPGIGMLSIFARGHGSDVAQDEAAGQSFSLSDMAEDLSIIIGLTLTRLGFSAERTPSIWLVGHSLGGAVVTFLTSHVHEREPSRPMPYSDWIKAALSGVAVLDVVEGSAIASLSMMGRLLESRPRTFESINQAVEWHLRTRALRNERSAWLSVPGMMKRQNLSTRVDPTKSESTDHARQSEKEDGVWVWRAPLEETGPYWENWFTGMSKRFLSLRTAKLLVLAGTDRLDKELMIGQMQGKFQLEVIPQSGHFIQEDEPVALVNILAGFLDRNDRSRLVLPKKVGGGPPSSMVLLPAGKQS